MGRIFTLTDDIKRIATDAFDDLLDTLGRQCRLYYPPKSIRCENCSLSLVGGKPSNKYLHGGPQPFPLGSLCPACGGNNIIMTEVYTDINLLITEDIAKYKKLENINIPNGSIRTKGYVNDMQKVMQCDYMIKDHEQQGILYQKYRLYGEILMPGNIIKNRYFVCYWERFQ